jgi:hypothetical protein
MSDERNPSDAYPQQHYGEHPGRFEVDARVWNLETPYGIVRYVDGVYGSPTTGRVTVELAKPDARIVARLTIGFVPEELTRTLNDVGQNAATLRANLAQTKIWLAECCSFGGGLQECGDLVGTEAVPVGFIADGNWGANFEIDVDCKAVRARIDFATPGWRGTFFANAKWAAVAPISDRDWMHARERMQLLISPKHKAITFNVDMGT